MGQKINFTKMHGAGNDYIYVDTLKYDIPHPSAALSHGVIVTWELEAMV